MEDFKISLAAARVNADMTQDDVAKALGVSKSTIIKWESYVTSPTLRDLNRYCDVVNCPVDAISLSKWAT